MLPRIRRPSAIRFAAVALAASAAGLAAIFAAGCGGAGGSAKSRYLARANAVCRDQAQAIKAVGEYYVQEMPFLPIYFLAAYLAVRKGVKAFDDVAGGYTGQTRYGSFSRNAYLDLLGALDRQAHAGDVAAFRADLRAAGQASSDTHALALQYGLVACAR